MAGSRGGACIAIEQPMRLGMKKDTCRLCNAGEEGAVGVRMKEREGETAKEGADISE